MPGHDFACIRVRERQKRQLGHGFAHYRANVTAAVSFQQRCEPMMMKID